MPRDLTRLAYCEVESLARLGEITPDDFDAYAYLWRTTSPRFTDTGLFEANRHARRHGLAPLESLDA